MRIIRSLIVVLSITFLIPAMAYADPTDIRQGKQSKDHKMDYLPNGIKRFVKNFKKLDLKYKDGSASMAKYGYNLYEDMNQLTNTGVRIRGGLSKVSKSATAGIEFVINW